MSKSKIDPIHLDLSTDALKTIEFEHAGIHSGSSYSCFKSQTGITDTNDRTIFGFTTPATTEIHMVVHAQVTAAADLIILEGATCDNSGADLTLYNRDRNSANTSELKSQETVQVAGVVSYYNKAAMGGCTGGTAIYTERIGAGQQGQATGGSSRGQNEFILKKSTVYDIELLSADANDNVHNLELIFYEHTPKNA